jgi:pimeloyl-ACP methyl ester carboxylesterase
VAPTSPTRLTKSARGGGAVRRPAWVLRSIGFGLALGIVLLSVLLLVLHVTAPPTVRPSATVAEAAPSNPSVTDVACWFSAPSGHAARCGVLSVPERWDVASSRRLQLRFAILRRTATVTTEPIVYISGGPGEPARLDAASIGYWWGWIDREPWLQTRELVLFDQRGVGMSEPRLDCPELAGAAYRVLGEALPLAASDAIWADAAAACHARLATAGVDLTSYNTGTIVADLKSLLAELGYRSSILLASSYGTRVALRLAADPAAGTRALILDAVDPPDARDYVDGAADAAAAFARLFENCAADTVCHAAFPDLAANFERVVAQAATAPLRIAVPDPRDGGTLSVRLDDAKLIETLFYAFYDWHRLEELPAVIAALAHGNSAPLKPLIGIGLANYDANEVSLGLFLSVECHDNFFFNPRGAVEREATAAPLFRNFALSTLPLAACPSWPAGRATEAERAPLTRDIPALMLVGELDPATPPQWAASAASHLPHAYVVKFRGVGHGVLAAQACAGRLVGGFLADLSTAPFDDCLLALGPPHFRKVASVEAR